MSLRRWGQCLGLAGMGLAGMLLGASCDSFFVMNGAVYECGTKTGIPQASGKAVRDAHPDLPAELFTTDNSGRYEFGFAAPTRISVTVSFEKAGYVSITQQFKGTPGQFDFCMGRAP